jgi:peptidoglycan hydrolase-like protein with peptidoglycan-binding domain
MFLPGTETVADANVEELSPQASQLKQLQAAIGVPQTGVYDKATFDGLKVFQASSGLEASGYPNEETIAALKRFGAALGDLTWWDWTLIYLFEYKWAFIGVGIGVIGGIGYWLIQRKKRKS